MASARRVATLTLLTGAAALAVPGASFAQTALPAPTGAPLKIDAANDPILGLSRITGNAEFFTRTVAAAVDRHPALTEAEAQIDQAKAQKGQARAALLPSADVSLSTYRTLDRQFGTLNPSLSVRNIVEKTRPTRQTDGLLSVNQLAFDGGAAFKRISAASARISAAVAGVDDAANRVALSTIGAWYDVFTFRQLLTLAEQYRKDQQSRRSDMLDRINQGVAAVTDLARVDSAVAGVDTRIANYRRQLANAEARYAELTGAPAPAELDRAPSLGVEPASAEAARVAALQVPSVKAAQDQARAARYDAKAVQADTYPTLGVSVVAGRYGFFETPGDYDVRALATVRARIGGGIQARADEAKARGNAQAARTATVIEEARRDAAIAWGDLAALNDQIAALQKSYLASRQSRDTIVERFRLTRGTLIDVLDSNDTYFAAAASYVETLADRDAAHYVLLARTGRLLDALGIKPANEVYRIR
ncbi:adhesin transport system outer membrane protein [Sphingomonas jinjuensis]|uniref:Adhesin transport system outer membrane protein n=1 Tax=Sphingomonas jinjuensis TaxID=535907 RepID=A0A840FMI7_9SPHN|nr:TolC family protein [Sphingomonas jinjuensis]MBB4155138.1 adhesin transport system outer membrane protein [Sphingomonas jinjuensis]